MIRMIRRMRFLSLPTAFPLAFCRGSLRMAEEGDEGGAGGRRRWR